MSNEFISNVTKNNLFKTLIRNILLFERELVTYRWIRVYFREMLRISHREIKFFFFFFSTDELAMWNSLDENTQNFFWIAHSSVEDSDNEPVSAALPSSYLFVE